MGHIEGQMLHCNEFSEALSLFDLLDGLFLVTVALPHGHLCQSFAYLLSDLPFSLCNGSKPQFAGRGTTWLLAGLSQ